MERRFQTRLNELLADAEVRPFLLKGVLPRLVDFLEPFVESLLSAEQRTRRAVVNRAVHRSRARASSG
jgi:hypothetical protein